MSESPPERRGLSPTVTHWLPTAVWLAVMFYFTSAPNPYSVLEPVGLRPADALYHVLGFGVLGILVARLVCRVWPDCGRGLWWALAFCVVYGVLDELHQYPIPGRSCNPWDMASDAVGAALGVGAVGLLRRWFAPSRSAS